MINAMNYEVSIIYQYTSVSLFFVYQERFILAENMRNERTNMQGGLVKNYYTPNDCMLEVYIWFCNNYNA